MILLYILDGITALVIINKLGKSVYRAGFVLGYKIGRNIGEKEKSV